VKIPESLKQDNKRLHGMVWSDQIRSGQVRSSQVRSGQVRSGRVRSDSVMSGYIRSDNVSLEGAVGYWSANTMGCSILSFSSAHPSNMLSYTLRYVTLRCIALHYVTSCTPGREEVGQDKRIGGRPRVRNVI
jgi:hypothetical protein